MIFLAFIIGFGYAIVVLTITMESLTYKPRNFLEPTTHDAPAGFSIIINYRDEAAHLPALLDSIQQLNYPKNNCEFLFINDASTDASRSIIEAFQSQHTHIKIRLLNRIPTSASAKKDGITQALQVATYNHILTTDADCLLPPQWLQAYHDHYTAYTASIFVAGPVQILATDTVIGQLQTSEMVALQLTTVGGFALRKPFLCNGANMSFTKTHFNEVAGYDGNANIASGDDIFLLEKSAALDASACYYLKDKNALVTTYPKTRWKEAIAQRARWAQKGAKTTSMLNKLLSFQVLAANAFVVIAPLIAWLPGVSIKAIVIVLALKTFTDIVVLYIGYRFFDNKKWLRYLLPQLVCYPILVLAVAFKSLTTVEWKQRQVQR